MNEQNTRIYQVYIHTNKENGKVYIGITSSNISKRAGSNGINSKKNTLFYRAIQKYGWDNFAHETLFTGLTINEAAKIEQDLIAKYQSNNPLFGYNISSGGESGNCGCVMSEEMRKNAVLFTREKAILATVSLGLNIPYTAENIPKMKLKK